MKRWLGWMAIGWLLLLCGVALLAYGQSSPAVSLRDRTRAVAQDLRCPVCQGESVADSPSGLAKSMRIAIRKRLSRGQNPDTVKAYFVSKYGDGILLAPPSSGLGRVAWLAPPLLVVGGLGLLLTLITDWRARGRGDGQPGTDQYLERVRAELEADTAGG